LGDNGDTGSKYMVESAIFGIADSDLPIHYATFMGLQWLLRVVYSWVPPSLSIFGRRWSGSRRPLLPAAGSQYTAVKLPIHKIYYLFFLHGLYVRCLLIDFSKAFDIVKQTIILSKLSALDLPSSILNWIIAFLSASLYVSKRGAYWDRLCRDVVGRWLVGWLVGWLSRACTVAKRCILGL